jgi:integrase
MTQPTTEGRARVGRRPKWPKIRPAGRGFLVDSGRAFSPRRRKIVADAATADKLADEWREERKDAAATVTFEATHRAVSLSKLTDRQRADVIHALDTLGDRGTLAGAVDFFLKHAAPENARSVDESIAELLAAVQAAGRRPRTVAEMKWRLEAFGEKFGKIPVATVTPRDVETYIAERTAKASPVTRDNERRGLFRLFAFAVRRHYAERNPIAALERTTADAAGSPEIHTPAEVGKVLAAAAKHAPRMLPYFALGYFAGLRPENELRGLRWNDIDFAAGLIHVRPETAKKRRERYVDLAANLTAWLAPHRTDAGQLFFSRRAFHKVRDESKVKWTPDVMRHTFATMHFAAHNDAPKTAAQLGHSGSPAVLFNHYRRLIRPEVAAEFWKIMPPDAAGRVVKIGRTRARAAG